jgi:CubicO group peptidase (beta-lactamase class C family)
LRAGAETKPIWGRKLPKTLDHMVSDLYSVRAPETTWEYNNFAFGMAGLLVEKLSDTEYEDYVVENILKPLGVETPHPVYPSPEMVELMALPYMQGGSSGKPQPVAQVHYDVYPAGDIYLTPEDMARFLGAHLNGGVFNGHRILSEESVAEMHTPQFGGTYGFGWSVAEDDNGHTIISHGGGIPGQSSFMMGDVDARVGVYYMSNSGAPQEIAEAAIALLRGEHYSPPAKKVSIGVARDVMSSYVGTYVFRGNSLTVTQQDRKLFVEGLGQGRNELLAETATKFFMAGNEMSITFEVDDGGWVTQLVVEVSGQRLVAERSS